MSRFWSPGIADLHPYVPGEQPKVDKLIKLNTNENPYPPSPKVAEALDAKAIDDLKLYPDPCSSALLEALADYHGLSTEQVFVGNGSDEVLAHAFKAFFCHRDAQGQALPLLFPDISYSFYPVYCQLFAIPTQPVALAADYRIDLDVYQDKSAGIIFPNPNAPTAMALALGEIEALLERYRDKVVIVDEAYVDFGADSAASLITRFPNLLVVQTYSKSRSLAGSRLGYALGSKELIDGLVRVKDSFNSYPIDRLAELAGIASLQDEAYFQDACAKICQTRDWTVSELDKLGFETLPSKANFVLTKPPVDAAELFASLRERKIIVRYFPKPRLSEYLRITVGTDDQMQALVEALKGII